MKSKLKVAACAALAMACAPVVARATTLFTDNFDGGTSGTRYVGYAQDNDTGGPAEAAGPLAEWLPSDPGYPGSPGLNPGGYDVLADFNFNYGNFKYWHISADESNPNQGNFIPTAPHSTGGTTIGLKIDVNNAAPSGTAVLNLYPKLSQYTAIPSGDHKLTFDLWMNYAGRFEGASGSTEWISAGINQAGGGIGAGIAAGDPNIPGLGLTWNGDRGNNNPGDYRLYRNNTRLGGPFAIDQEAGYVAVDEGLGNPSPADGRNQFYKNLFTFTDPNNAADQWYETPGAMGKHWTTIEIKYEDGIVYYYAQPQGAPTQTLIAARTDESVQAGQVMLGYADFNSGVCALETGDGSVTAHDANFAIVDNVVVETIQQVRPKWNVNANGNWSSAGNWLNGVPNSNIATADFTDGISGSGKTITVDGNQTVRSMVFDNAQSYTLDAGAGGKITLDSLTTGILGTIKVKSGSHTINAPIDTKRIVWTDVAGGSTLAINGVITELVADPLKDAPRYLQKTGAGTLVLGGNGNAWRGDTRIQGGTVRLAANNAIPNNGATTILSTGTTLDTNGFNFTTGQLRVNGASVVGSGTITLGSHLFSTGGGTVAANVNFTPVGGFTGHRELVQATAPLTISGNISGTPKLHQYSTGTDPTITLSGTNTYTGATAIRGGNLVVASNAPSGAAGALGNSTTPVEVGDSTVTPLTAVRVASTGSVGGTFSAAGNTITFGTAVAAVDGVTLADGDRILLKDQVDPNTGLQSGAPQNGIWVRTNANVWTRATDLDETSELAYGNQVSVTAGTANAGKKYYLFEGSQMNTSLQIWGQEIQNASLLTGGAVTIGRDVNVVNGTATANSVYSIGGATAHNSTFSGAVTLNRAVTLTAATGGTANFTGNIVTNDNNITKAGAGAVVVKNLRGSGTVNVALGTLAMAPDSSAAGTSKVGNVTIAPTARLDLRSNKLITTTAPGTATGGVYSGLQGEVQRASNFGAWDQPGLTTSEADAVAGLTTIGIATGEQVRGLGPTDTDTFAGQTITGASTIAMYTYAGDANLDGTIDGGDYGIIDNFSQVPNASGYANGDFNYDSVIDGGDYGIIDNNNQAQGAPFPTSGAVGLSGVTAVPEPSACALVLFAGAALGARRRRRRCDNARQS